MHDEIRLDDRRFALADRLQLLQDVINVGLLLPSAMARLAPGPLWMRALGALELAAAAAALAAAALALRRRERPGIAWPTVLGGLVLIGEGVVRFATTGDWWSPQLVGGLTSVAIGLFSGRLAERRRSLRRIHFSDTALEARLSPFRRVRVDRAEVAAVDELPGVLRFRLHDGSVRKLPLRWIRNHTAVRAAVADWLARDSSPPEPLPRRYP